MKMYWLLSNELNIDKVLNQGPCSELEWWLCFELGPICINVLANLQQIAAVKLV